MLFFYLMSEVLTSVDVAGPPVGDEKATEKPCDDEKKEDVGKDLRIKLGGLVQFDALFCNQDREGSKEGSRPHLTTGYTNFKLNVESNPAKDFTFGYLIRLQPQVGKSKVIDRNYIWMGHKKFGRLEFGNNKGAHDSMFKFALELMGGTKFWDGDYSQVYNDGYGYFNGIDPVGNTNVATKITYFTPVMSGFQFGVSYTPSTGHIGGSDKNNQNPYSNDPSKITGNLPDFWFNEKKSPVGHGHVDLVAKFEHEIDDIRFGFAGLYMMDDASIYYKDARNFNIRKTRSWGISGKMGCKNTSLGIEYINNGRSRLPKDDEFSPELTYRTPGDPTSEITNKDNVFIFKNAHKGHAGESVMAVVQQCFDENHTMAFGYQRTSVCLDGKNRSVRNSYAVTFDKKFREGLVGYVEVDFLNSKTPSAETLGMDKRVFEPNPSNKGMIFLVGVRVIF